MKQKKKQEKAKGKRSSGATNTPPPESNDGAPQPAKKVRRSDAEIRDFKLNEVAQCLPYGIQRLDPDEDDG